MSQPVGCKRAAPWLDAALSRQRETWLNRRCEYVGAVGRVSAVRLNVERQEGVEVAPYSRQTLVIAQKVATRDRGGLDVKAPSHMGLRPAGGVGAIRAGGLAANHPVIGRHPRGGIVAPEVIVRYAYRAVSRHER